MSCLSLHVCWQMNDSSTVIEVKAWMTTVSKEGTFSPNPFKRVQDSTSFHQDWGRLLARGFRPETLSVWASKVCSISFKILWVLTWPHSLVSSSSASHAANFISQYLPVIINSCLAFTFSVTAPKLWKLLPLQISSSTSLSVFSSQLKTYFFSWGCSASD